MRSILFLVCFIANHLSIGQDRTLDSLYSALEHHPQKDTIRAQILFKLCYREYEARPERSKILAEELLLISKKVNYIKGESVAFRYLAEYYENIGDNGQATKYAYLWLDAADKSSYGVGMARAYEMLGQIKELEGDFKSSIDNYLMAIEIFQHEKLKLNLGYAYNNVAGTYLKFSKLENAINYTLKSLAIMKELKNENGIGLIYTNLGEIYLKKKEYAMALNAFETAIPINVRLNNKARLINCYAGLGETHLHTGTFDNSESYLLQSIDLAKIIRNKGSLENSYQVLALLERKRGRFEKALMYSELKSAYHDSIYTEEKAKQIADVEARYETEKKDHQIEILERDKKIQILWRNIFVTAFILVTLASLILYFLQKFREKKNREILNLKIDALTSQQQELSEKYKNSLASRDETNVVSHDQRLLKRTINIIEENISDSRFSVEKMSDELGMSRTNLHRRLKAITGFPPSELIRNIRLRKAALLLRSETDSISQIGFAVGFEDHSYFSKAFKKQYGVTPSDYLQSAIKTETAISPSNGL